MPKTLSWKAKVSTQRNKNSGCGNELLSLGGNEGSWKTQMEKWTHAVASEVSSQWGISRKGSLGNTQRTCLLPTPASPNDDVPIDQTVGWWGGGWLCTAGLGCTELEIMCLIPGFCSLESTLTAAELDWGVKIWCLGDVLWDWKRGRKRGDTCRCDRDSPANQTWVHGSASRNECSVATGLCYSVVSPALILPTCLLSSLLVNQFSICS